MEGFTKFLLVVAIIGGLNWGLVGFFNWNLVNAIFGGSTSETVSAFSRVIYALVGVASLISLFMLPRLHEGEKVRVHRRAEIRP